MLAATRPMRRSSGPRSSARNDSLLSTAARRVGAFALTHPGTVALALLFGGLCAAVSTNALWMQSERHPAPLFHQASLQPQHSFAVMPRKIPEPPAVAPASAPAADDAEAVLPPSRPSGLGRAFEPGSTAPAKPAAGKRQVRDPIADLLGEKAPVPPAPIKSSLTKGQTVEKAARTPASSSDSIAGLIEQTARSR
jgi:hypothetical protein